MAKKLQREDPDVCGANKTKGGTCTHVAGYGTDHVGYGRCKFHGGSTPTGKTSAAREEMEDIVRGLGHYGSPVDIEPHDALLQEVKRTAGHVAWLEDRISNHEFTGEEHIDLAVTRDLYQHERKHLTHVCSVAIGAGIAERQVRIAEQWGKELSELIGAILSDLRLTPAQKEKAPEVVRNHLRLVERAA